MRYLTGEHALNLECELLTCGDWHTSALRWKNLNMQDTEDSIFGEYGLEYDRTIPDNDGLFIVANHIRALLDLLDQGKFTIAQGMREDFICNEDYTAEIFDKVMKLQSHANWLGIERFMAKEYTKDWVEYIKKRDGNFSAAQGMREDFTCDETYPAEFFDVVIKLQGHENWGELDRFMQNEYQTDWTKYKEEKIK